MDPPSGSVTDGIVARVLAAVGGHAVTPAGIVNIITRVLVEVEACAGMSGPQKKELAAHVVETIVAAAPGSREERAALRAAVDLLLPGFVDALVAASKGQYALNAPPLLLPKSKKCCTIS